MDALGRPSSAAFESVRRLEESKQFVPARYVEDAAEQGVQAIQVGQVRDLGKHPLVGFTKLLAAQAEQDFPRLLSGAQGLALFAANGLTLARPLAKIP